MSWRFLWVVAVVPVLLVVACGQSQDVLPRSSPTPCPPNQPKCLCDYHEICRVVYDHHGSMLTLKVSDELKRLAEDCGVEGFGYFGRTYDEKTRTEFWIGQMLSLCWPADAEFH